MELKEKVKGFLACETKTLSTNDEYVEVEGYANYLSKDRDGDIIIPSGIDLSHYKKNPIILYQHNQKEPCGKAMNIELRSDGLYVKARIYKALHEKAYNAVKLGVLKTFSIGFIALDGEYDNETDTFFFKKIELFEVSVVSVPSNRDSVFEVLQAPCGDGFCLAQRNFSKTLKGQGKIKIDNSKISDRKWSDVDKTTMAQKLEDIGDKKVINEAYLYIEDYDERSTWCCPHHELEDNTLVLNKNGVIAAYQALEGAHGTKPNIPAEDLNKAYKHIAKHYKQLFEAGVINDIPEKLKEVLDMKEETKNQNNELTVDNIVAEIAKQSGVSEEEVIKMLLFMNFAIFKKDGTLTKFAEKYKIRKNTWYEDLYSVLKQMKEEYKSDRERNAFTEIMKSLALSSISRASAWIYDTYVKTDDGNKEEQLLTSRTFAEAWFFNTMGITLDNLLKFKSVVKLMDKYSDVVSSFVNSRKYTKEKESKSMIDEKVKELEAKIAELEAQLKKQKTLSLDEVKEFLLKEIESGDVDGLLGLYEEVGKHLNAKLTKILEGDE